MVRILGFGVQQVLEQLTKGLAWQAQEGLRLPAHKLLANRARHLPGCLQVLCLVWPRLTGSGELSCQETTADAVAQLTCLQN